MNPDARAAQARTATHWQRFSVPYEFPVVFTEGVFDPENPVLRDVLTRLEPAKRHRAVFFVDDGLKAAHASLPDAIVRYAECHRDAIELACAPVLVPGGEKIKAELHFVESVQQTLFDLHVDRHSYVIAVGGGAVLDAVGLVAALPFDAARMGGRFIDLFRGTSAEASLPVAGTREAATGDVLYQLLVGLVVTGGLFPVVLSALVRGFAWVRLGAWVPGEAAVLHLVGLAGGAMATGFAVGAPVAAAAMAVDALVGRASRAAPQANLQEMGSPLKILGGGALLWLGVGVLCERLLAGVHGVEEALALLAEVAR